VSITPRGVHDKTSFVGADSLCKSFGAFVDDNIAPTLCARFRHIDEVPALVMELRHNNVTLELGLTNLTHDLRTIDSEISKIEEELLRTILTAEKAEKLGTR